MKSIRNILSFFIFILSTSIVGQHLSQETLVGTWQVIDASPRLRSGQQLDKGTLDYIKKGMEGTAFKFNENGTFQSQFTNDRALLKKDLTPLNDQYWKLFADNDLIKIGTKENNYSSMSILIEKDKTKLYFIIPGMKLTVSKLKSE